jgi:tetratricopeptide (TPR) repeat protein
MDEEMQELMTAIQVNDGTDLMRVDRLIADYPNDPRLHFLRGSILAGIGRPIEALPALNRAVELAPDFAIARFQLGFFQLTSGEAANALGTWGPIALLPADHYLRKFVAGLTHLIRDEFAEAQVQLREGIALNEENPPLNRDMQLIIDQVQTLLSSPPKTGDDASASATSFLLGQLTGRGTTH